MTSIFCSFSICLFVYLFVRNVQYTECLNVTCHNQIGSHPFHRTNTCYVRRLDRNLGIDEKLSFLQSYSTPNHIKTLDISTKNTEPGIDHVPVEVFPWFPNLESLRVNSKVTSISANDLELSANLTQLVISYGLQYIKNGIFPSNNKLTFLSFESNQITTIENYAFENLNRLFSLKLQENHLEIIRQHTFSGLSALFVLNLNENRIRVIENGAFAGLDQLQFLHLQGNQLETLYDGIFHGLRSLIDISLGGNKITRINSSLQYLNLIKKIDLNYNQIEDIDLNEFAKLPSLVDLRLINSGFIFNKTIQSRNERNPSRISMLEYLYLDNNNMSNSLDLKNLDIFGELKELSLDDNLYEHFDVGVASVKNIWPNLQYLSLEGNHIDQSVLSSISDQLTAAASATSGQ